MPGGAGTPSSRRNRRPGGRGPRGGWWGPIVTALVVYLIANLCMAAEQVVHRLVTTGAENDLEQVTGTARGMVDGA